MKIATNQAVVTDLSDVHILPRSVLSGDLVVEYKDGEYAVYQGKQDFKPGDQFVFLATWPEDLTLLDDNYNAKHVVQLICHLSKWRLTNTSEIKKELIPILKRRLSERSNH